MQAYVCHGNTYVHTRQVGLLKRQKLIQCVLACVINLTLTSDPTPQKVTKGEFLLQLLIQ